MTTLDHQPTKANAPGVSVPSSVRYVAPAALDAQLRVGAEVALLDIREVAPYAAGHIVLATSVPWSDFESRVVELVPRRGTPVVVYDDGSGLAAAAAGRLGELGYSEAAVLAGGLDAWTEAGLSTVDGVGVISKALGEFVSEREKTPKITVHDLKALECSEADFVLVDTRPVDEFSRESIPDGLLAPGAELLYRIHDLVESEETLIVVNCAGRTRGLIGAQALINAGLPNPVVALDNGTAAWQIAGFEIAVGRDGVAPAPTPQGLERARASAAVVTRRFGVRTIDRAQFDAFTASSDDRTTFVLDVRTPEEYEAGHVCGARSAPGGQLVQSRDDYIGTQYARVVLVDGPDGVRAIITASWLLQIGIDEVYVFATDLGSEDSESGPVVTTGVTADEAVRAAADLTISPIKADQLRRVEPVTILDIGSSRAYQNGHLPGASWIGRADLERRPDDLPGHGLVIVTSDDGRAARHAALDLARLTPRRVVAVAGGTAAWRQAGLSLETESAEWLAQPLDFWVDHKSVDERRIWLASYVQWAEGVVEQLQLDGSVRFRTFDDPGAPGISA